MLEKGMKAPDFTLPDKDGREVSLSDFRGKKVPEALLGGNHADIAAWRREQSLQLTLERRPELLDSAPLTDSDRAMLARLKRAGAVDALLHAHGVLHQRLPLKEAEQWPKRWFAAFVPEACRKAAKKHCLSGRRHTGSLWRACSMGFIPDTVEGDAAWQVWQDHSPGDCLLYLPGDALLYRTRGVPSRECLDALGGAMLSDEGLTRAFLQTGQPGCGPYYCEVEKARTSSPSGLNSDEGTLYE